jgi:hypothetical protein
MKFFVQALKHEGIRIDLTDDNGNTIKRCELLDLSDGDEEELTFFMELMSDYLPPDEEDNEI